jgi:hypothetical protein
MSTVCPDSHGLPNARIVTTTIKLHGLTKALKLPISTLSDRATMRGLVSSLMMVMGRHTVMATATVHEDTMSTCASCAHAPFACSLRDKERHRSVIVGGRCEVRRHLLNDCRRAHLRRLSPLVCRVPAIRAYALPFIVLYEQLWNENVQARLCTSSKGSSLIPLPGTNWMRLWFEFKHQLQGLEQIKLQHGNSAWMCYSEQMSVQ